MRASDVIEREIHRRFSEQVYAGMSTTDYHSALTHVIIRYVAEQLAAAQAHKTVGDTNKI